MGGRWEHTGSIDWVAAGREAGKMKEGTGERGGQRM